MPTAGLAPLDETITIAELALDPYPIYRRLRSEAPVLRVKSVGRTYLTKAADTRLVKDNAALFSSNDPNTPMERAFLARTLMRRSTTGKVTGLRSSQASKQRCSPLRVGSWSVG